LDILDALKNLIAMPELVTTLVGSATVAAGAWIATRVRGRPRVKHLVSSTDEDFAEFYKLCLASFDHDEVEPQSEMARYLDDSQNKSQPFEDYFAVLKKGRQMCGLINGTIYANKRIGFINYMAIDVDSPEARSLGAAPLLRAFRSRLRQFGCDAILYETEVLGANLPRAENDARRGRGRLFARIAQGLKMTAFELPLEYRQPKLSILDGLEYPEVPLVLMYVPLQAQFPSVSRQKLETLLSVVLFHWYLDIYDEEGATRDAYSAYLSELFDRLMTGVPERVVLKPATRNWSPPVRDHVPLSPEKPPKGLSPARRRRRQRTTTTQKV